MKRVIFSVLALVLVAAAYPRALPAVGPPINAHPDPPGEHEFYWDDGTMSNFWCWYTGGNYWAVQFDEEKTGGADGYVVRYGAVTYPDWPDSTYQGCNMHTFADESGSPGGSLDSTYLGFTEGGVFQWVEPDSPVLVTGGVFYIAFEQLGTYPDCDSIAVDALAGTHNWTGYGGFWSPTDIFGDFMIRCYWDDEAPEDFQPPYVEDLSPADGAEDVPVNTVIIFHTKDDLSGVDPQTVRFTAEYAPEAHHRFALFLGLGARSPAGAIPGALYIDDSNPNDMVCIFIPDEDLDEGALVICTVGGELADYFGNAMGDDFLWAFSTREQPSVENVTWGRIKALY
ncbi:MAG TPA: hypothetical protein ENN88_04625 [Candidatus Coatesbacteria bacterium]|nr:hypothetical protein [Candidatus Coatesbacteria bacterium]